MTMTERGKFCSYCSKSVVDFTQLTDNEVLQIIEQSSGKLCGRLTLGQLNRSIQLEQPTSHSKFYQTLAGLLLVATSENLMATDNQKIQQDVISIVDNQDVHLEPAELKTEPTDSLKNVVQGLVIDANTKEPVPFASVFIKGSKIGTTTDLDGKFKFVIPDSFIANKVILVVAYVGYKRTEAEINKSDWPLTQKLVIAPAEQVLMGDVIVVKKKKWWQRKNKSNH